MYLTMLLKSGAPSRTPAPRLSSCMMTVVAVRLPFGALLKFAASHVILMHGLVCGLSSSGTSSSHSAARHESVRARVGCGGEREASGRALYR